MRICRNCNSTMEDGMMFCPECGVKYISFDEQIYASESCPVFIAEQNMFLDDGRLQAVIILGNAGEKTISACAIRLKCLDAFGTELADTVVKYNDLSAMSQTMFGDDKLIALVDEDTRDINVVVEMLVFEDGTKWNGTTGEWKPTDTYNEIRVRLRFWEEFLAIEEGEEGENQKNEMLREHPNVELPFGVTEIPDCAFMLLTNLISITIPNSVTSIGNMAFSMCDSLTSVTIPNSVISIGENAFSGCNSLTSVTIQEGVTSIGNMAFCTCQSLSSIIIPESVTSIGKDAFGNCTSLKEVILLSDNIYIAENAFHGCPAKIIRKDEIEKVNRFKKYWNEHSEEKQQLESELLNLENEIKQFESQLKDGCSSSVPSEKEKDTVLNEISKLRKEQGQLGTLKIMQKKRLQAQINELMSKIPEINKSIESEKREQQDNYNAEMKNKIATAKKRIDEINRELTKDR